MDTVSAIHAEGIRKKYKGFTLDIPKLDIPKGFATALIGENGAGKTTLLNILAGIRLDYTGKLVYFEEENLKDEQRREQVGYAGPGCYFLPNWKIKQVKEISGLLFDSFSPEVYEEICRELGIGGGVGYAGPGCYFLPNWKIKQVKEISGLLFDSFSPEVYEEICRELGIGGGDFSKKVSALSDGNRMKLTLAAVLARDTKCLLLDEPASPLDPLMRDKLCGIIREYLEQGDGERSVFFSTHNISDMENVTDYCIIMENGRIAEQGFVEDLKEKYILVKGEAGDAEAAKKVLYSYSGSSYGFEGICLAEDADKLAGMDICIETPSLFQISVAVMRAKSGLHDRLEQL